MMSSSMLACQLLLIKRLTMNNSFQHLCIPPASAKLNFEIKLCADDTRAREGLLHVAALLAPFPELDLVTAGKVCFTPATK
jgi:hypothetical protein